MTFVQVTPANKDTLYAVHEGSQDKRQIYSTAAHHANQSDIGCVLLSGDPSQIGGAVRSPVAYKTQQPGFKLNARAHFR
jgi:hypothetical protein